jgi:hypothetical protein
LGSVAAPTLLNFNLFLVRFLSLMMLNNSFLQQRSAAAHAFQCTWFTGKKGAAAVLFVISKLCHTLVQNSATLSLKATQQQLTFGTWCSSSSSSSSSRSSSSGASLLSSGTARS